MSAVKLTVTGMLCAIDINISMPVVGWYMAMCCSEAHIVGVIEAYIGSPVNWYILNGVL